MKILPQCLPGAHNNHNHILVCDWGDDSDGVIQWGANGLVFEAKILNEMLTEGKIEHINQPVYNTAFFEAFPNKPDCFLRGEGKTIEEAERQCFASYQRVKSCTSHDWDRRNRTDGYAFCKKCNMGAMALEPLTKCCKCNVPTHHTEDINGDFYCKIHQNLKPRELFTKSDLYFEEMRENSRLFKEKRKKGK